MNRIALLILAITGSISFIASAWAEFERIEPVASPFRLSGVVFTDVPSFAEHESFERWGAVFECHLAGWDGDVYIIEATYCSTDREIDSSAGWKQTSPGEFFSYYNRLKNVTDYELGDNIDTFIGEASVVRFDAFQNMPDGFHCIGVITSSKRRGKYFKETLDLYICNNGNWALDDDKAISVIRGLKLEGVFDALLR